MTLPASIEEVDGAWLAAALGVDGEIAVTSAAPVTTGTAYSTRMYRLTLDGPNGTPASAIVKLPVTTELRTMLDAIGVYQREVTFYADLAEDLPVRVPKPYVAQIDPATNDFVLAIEDLSELHPPDQLGGLTLEQAGSAVDALARFHAWAWESPRLDEYADRFPRLDGDMAAGVYGQFAQFFGMAWPSVREAPVATDEARAVGDRWQELLPFFVSELATPRTLVHGELRAENLFILPDGEILMIDFQTVAQHAGVVDVAYLVVQSLRADVRRGQDEGFVQRYVDGLAAAGVEGYSFDEAWRQYRIALAFNLLLTGLAFAEYERTDDRGKALLVEMLGRASDAITTCDTLEILP